MASRKVPLPESKPPTLPPARATHLFRQQVQSAQILLSKPEVARLDFESWEQTTRAVLVGAFGDPSENVGKFDRASPGYPARIGADERFWAKYRRDELEAKVSAVGSCIAQLAMGLGATAEDRPAEPHPHEAARRVLKALHDIFLQAGHMSWSISPVRDGQDSFAHVGLDVEGARKALRLLVAKRLAKHMGTDAFVITQYGVSACDHPSTLEHELPLDGGDEGERRTRIVDLGDLAKVGDLLASDDIRGVVARDLAELKFAAEVGLPKCTMLLGGSILEAILIDVLDRNRAVASTYLRKTRFPEEASLPDLIAIAGDPSLLDPPRHLLTPTSVALAKAVTDHRDLIHPHAEARGRIRVDETTAKGVLHLLNIVVRDLVEADKRGDIDAYVSK